METRGKIILVTGATGKQGGAVACHLLKDGWQVRALTRDRAKLEACDLSNRGVEVVQGDLNTITSDHRAFKDLYGIFSVQTFAEEGLEAEVRQGQRLADIAHEIGIKHFVYTSVGGADRATGVGHFETKWQIEQHIRSLGLPATIVRPVWFMDNFNAANFRQEILEGLLRVPMHPDRPLQMIAVDDIGGFVAMVFRRPEEYLGKAIELAGDELTLPQVAEQFSAALGRKVEFVETPLEEVRSVNENFAAMFEWFNQKGYEANIAELRAIYPPLMTFEEWLRKTGWTRHPVEAEISGGI